MNPAFFKNKKAKTWLHTEYYKKLKKIGFVFCQLELLNMPMKIRE